MLYVWATATTTVPNSSFINDNDKRQLFIVSLNSYFFFLFFFRLTVRCCCEKTKSRETTETISIFFLSVKKEFRHPRVFETTKLIDLEKPWKLMMAMWNVTRIQYSFDAEIYMQAAHLEFLVSEKSS